MDTLLERWCESRPWYRVLFWCLGSLLAGLAAWGTLLRPLDRQCAERQRHTRGSRCWKGFRSAF